MSMPTHIQKSQPRVLLPYAPYPVSWPAWPLLASVPSSLFPAAPVPSPNHSKRLTSSFTDTDEELTQKPADREKLKQVLTGLIDDFALEISFMIRFLDDPQNDPQAIRIKNTAFKERLSVLLNRLNKITAEYFLSTFRTKDMFKKAVKSGRNSLNSSYSPLGYKENFFKDRAFQKMNDVAKGRIVYVTGFMTGAIKFILNFEGYFLGAIPKR